jgi:TonB family protein
MPQEKQSPELLQSRELNASVMKLYAEGKYDEAMPLAKRALELREQALGLEHQDLIPLLLNLGELCRTRKKHDDAKAYFERASQIGERVFGQDDLRVARLLDKLALTVYEQHDDKKAETLFERSLAIREKVLGKEHPDLFQTAFNLAEIYRLRRDYQKAEPLYQRVIRIKEKTQSQDHNDLVKALDAYATLLFAMNRAAEGTQVQKRIAELSAGPDVVQGGVLNGKALSLPTPDYPVAARMDRASGTVRVQVLIDETGKVIQAKAIDVGSTHMALRIAAENAARRARFTPTLLSGVPIKVMGIIIYNFVAY